MPKYIFISHGWGLRGLLEVHARDTELAAKDYLRGIDIYGSAYPSKRDFAEGVTDISHDPDFICDNTLTLTKYILQVLLEIVTEM